MPDAPAQHCHTIRITLHLTRPVALTGSITQGLKTRNEAGKHFLTSPCWGVFSSKRSLKNRLLNTRISWPRIAQSPAMGKNVGRAFSEGQGPVIRLRSDCDRESLTKLSQTQLATHETSNQPTYGRHQRTSCPPLFHPKNPLEACYSAGGRYRVDLFGDLVMVLDTQI